MKGRSAPDIINSPSRLLYPMKRTRPKGCPDPGWERISWAEALATVSDSVSRIKEKYCPESLAFSITTRSGTAILDSFSWILRLARALGTPNCALETEACNWHKDFATAFTFGAGTGMPDFEKTRCIMLWGFNPAVTWPSFSHEVVKALKRGARLIAVDPRKAGLAAKAHEWLRVRPGTDGAIALGIAGVMIEGGLFDRTFIEDWTNGPHLVKCDDGRLLTEAHVLEGGSAERPIAWDIGADRPMVFDRDTLSYPGLVGRPALFGEFEVKTLNGVVRCRPSFELYSKLCLEYTPERVEAITGVPAGQILSTARLLHENGPVSFFAWTGIGQQTNSTQTTRAITLLYALTGCIDAPGGNVYFTKPSFNDVSGWDLLPQEQRMKALGLAERPLGPARNGWITSADLYRAVNEKVPYPIRGLIGFGGNLLVSQPEVEYGKRALETLEFYVHADPFMNPTAEYADVVLPVALPWEREGLGSSFQISQEAESLVQLRRRVVEPMGEAKSDLDIVFDLAKRLGLEKDFFGGDIEEGLRHILAPAGLSLEELKRNDRGLSLPLATRYFKYKEKGFNTRGRLIEIFSSELLGIGQDPLPVYREPAVGPVSRPDFAEKFPLVLTSYKCIPFLHSQHRNVEKLRKVIPEPLIEIHPDTADERDISDGDAVLIRTSRGSITAIARTNGTLVRGVVCSQYGWWKATVNGKVEQANYNSLIGNGELDPVSGSAPLRGYLCEIEKLRQ
jgi:anaerobic selenocysteine-containing dehydrogenase